MKPHHVTAVVLCVCLSAPGAARAATEPTAFPNYTREQETTSCVYGYGMENSSILDCIARDQTYRATLAKAWPDIDVRFKSDCVSRLSKRRMNSYFYLDRCIQGMKRDAAAPPD